MALSKGFVQNSAAGPLDARLMDGARVVHNADGTVRTGVLWSSGTGGAVIGSQSTMNVVAVGADFVLSRSGTDGAVVLANRGNVIVPIPAAPASNSRYDVVYVKQNDGGTGGQGDSDSTSAFFVVSGTAAASPTVPTVPTGALALATVLVPSGVTATNAAGVVITNVFQTTALYGSPILFTALSALKAATAAPETLARITGNTSTVYRYTGAAWLPVNGTSFAQRTGSGSLASATVAAQLPMGDSASTLDGNLISIPSQSLTPAFSGWYRVTGRVNWASNASGVRYLEAWLNGSAFAGPVGDHRPAAANLQTFSAVMPINAGQAVGLAAFQSSGAALNYTATLTLELVALT